MRYFTKEERDFVVNNHKVMSIREMAEHLGKTYYTVYQHMKDRNIPFQVKYRRRVPKQEVESEFFNVDKLETWLI